MARSYLPNFVQPEGQKGKDWDIVPLVQKFGAGEVIRLTGTDKVVRILQVGEPIYDRDTNLYLGRMYVIEYLHDIE